MTGPWALGDYPTVARELGPELGNVVVMAAGIRPGHRVLDVAAGTGRAAVAAARLGADVIASDLTPELLEAGRREAASLPISWEVGDAESLPYRDGRFDAVVSCVGVMFAPRHQVAADELVRVCRRGGTIGLLSWTPTGFNGQLFSAMKPYAPQPPPDAGPPVQWGDETYVRSLLGGRVTEVVASRDQLSVDRFGTAEEYRDYMKVRYGPVIATYRAIADDPAKVAALDAAIVDLARRHGADGGAMAWEYLLLTARRA